MHVPVCDAVHTAEIDDKLDASARIHDHAMMGTGALYVTLPQRACAPGCQQLNQDKHQCGEFLGKILNVYR